MQYLYAAEISDFEDTKEHYKNLTRSIHSIHNLYLFQISFLIEILSKATNKYNISKESISGNISNIYTNKRFSENILLNDLASNSKIDELIKSKDFINWEVDFNYVNIIYDKIIKSDLYDSYISNETKSFQIDIQFVHDIFREIIVTDEKFQTFIEEKNIFWMDDFPLTNTLLLKFFKNSTKDNYEKLFHFKLFANVSDKKFSDDLANYSLRNFESNNKIISEYIANWDIERLAKIDLVIINLAITELKIFKEIPIKVSLNEYIEISKDYSTEKSSFFINGILDKIVKDLISNNSLIKEGRGLRE
jgi:N utilization substance protein B